MNPWRQKQARGAKKRALYVARLAIGEVLISYARDCALCKCPPIPREVHRKKLPLECILVGRNKGAGTDRCLQCGTAWTLREYRKDPAKIVSRVLVEAA